MIRNYSSSNKIAGHKENIPMKNLCLISKDGVDAIFSLSDIENIHFELAKEICNESDIAGNKLCPNDMLMIIAYKDGRTATFIAKNWTMNFS